MSAPPPERKCALCGKPQEFKLRPFCSKRCADLDLGRWLNGEYAIPGNEPEDDADAEPEPNPDRER